MSFNAALMGDKNEDPWVALAKDYKNLGGGGKDHPGTLPALTMLKAMDSAWPFSKATAYLDNGCGPGVIMQLALQAHGAEVPSSCRLVCSDFSPAMLQAAEATKAAEVEKGDKLWERVEMTASDACDMSNIEDNSFSHISAGMVYFMVDDPQKALSESRRILTSEYGGGVLSLSSWKDNEWVELMRNSLAETKPGNKFPEIPEAWKSVDGVKGEMDAAGFKDVDVREVETYMHYEDAKTTCRMLATKMPIVAGLMKQWSKEDVEAYIDNMTKELVGMYGEKNGTMKGTVVVGLGRK